MDRDFTLIPFRKIDESINVNEVCLANKINLPILYRTFLETFVLGETSINRRMFYSKEFDDYFDFEAYIYIRKKEIGFMYFLDFLDAINLFKTGGFGEAFFPIASSEGNGLTVCIKGENADKIYFEDTDGEEKKLVAENIFEFLRGIEIVKLDEKFLAGQVKYSDLYRKYGNKHWEVIKNLSV